MALQCAYVSVDTDAQTKLASEIEKITNLETIRVPPWHAHPCTKSPPAVEAANGPFTAVYAVSDESVRRSPGSARFLE